MIEAKGPGFAKMLENDFMRRRIRARWVKQATSQLQASKGRDLEWYFAEADAAVKAERIFAYYDWIKGKIKIIHKPALVQ